MVGRLFDYKLIALAVLCAMLATLMNVFGPHDTLDVRLFYSAEQSRALFESFTPEAARAYLINEIVDCFFIWVYSLALVVAYLRTFTTKRMLILAFAPGLFDLTETLNVINALGQGTMVPDWLGWITLGKWSLAALALMALAAGRFRKPQSRSLDQS